MTVATPATSANAYDFIVVANRLPVDRKIGADGEPVWQRSPGGLVTALAPVMENNDGAWVGWHGAPDETVEPFDQGNMHLVPVPLSAEDVEMYYEGFSNATLWPLYHDVIVPPEYHRTWWDRYERVNRRFAEAVSEIAAPNAVVWVQDYQLQLVPAMLRAARPDVKIGFFNHIPFPPYEIFAQLPWRARILDGLLGADLVGFQRQSDANNFLRSIRRLRGHIVRGSAVHVHDDAGTPTHISRAEAHPISIDTQRIIDLAKSPEVQERAKQIRSELGNPDTVLLGVDRLDYTKGIAHRIKAFGELLDDGRLSVGQACLVQVASPSRERVGSYLNLREEVEGLVGRINGEHDTLSHTAIRYLHHSYPVEEMVAMYMVADVILVTALRDGMNLVAKEYVASQDDQVGVLVLSEFTGAADQLRHAIQVNPHDIDGLKDAIVQAVEMPEAEAKRRMRIMRRHILSQDVTRWSETFLRSLSNEEIEVGAEK